MSQRCKGSSTWKPAGGLAAESDRMVSARKLDDGDIICELCQRGCFLTMEEPDTLRGGAAAASVKADAVRGVCVMNYRRAD